MSVLTYKPKSNVFKKGDLSIDKQYKYSLSYLTVALASIMISDVTMAAHAQTVYSVQIASYASQAQAQRELVSFQKYNNLHTFIRKAKAHGQDYYQIQAGPYQALQQARVAQKQLTHTTQKTFIRAYPATAEVADITAPVDIPTTSNEDSTFLGVIPQSIPTFENKLVSSTNLVGFPYYPRALIQGTGAQQTNFFDGDIMVPFIGNNDWISYLDGAGKYGDDKAWFGSVGAGVRGVRSNTIFGAYLFSDSNVSTHNRTFWVLNPGLEVMGNEWDAHLNGYFPVSKKQKPFHQNALLTTQYFNSHALYERLFQTGEVVGNGVDGEIGYRWPLLRNVRTFIGGYHFNPHHALDISGVEGGFELPITSYATILVHDAYDKVQRNTIMGTLRLTFGGLDKPVPTTIYNRMLDPLQRHLGAYQTGSGIPITRFKKTISKTVVQDNIWFFTPNATTFAATSGFNNCTYEHPCGTLNQTAIDGINNLALNANFFIDTGVYAAVAGGLRVNNGQRFYGRQLAFTQPAQGTNRPLINNTLSLFGNNTIDSLQVVGNAGTPGLFDVASIEVLGNANGPVTINNSSLTATTVNPVDGTVGLFVGSNDSPITFTNNSVTVNTTTAVAPTGAETLTIGLWNFSTSAVNVDNSLIAVNSTNALDSVNDTFGIDNVFGTIVLTNSTVNTSVANFDTAMGRNTGIINFNAGTIVIDKSNINVTTNNNSLTIPASILTGVSNSGTNGTITMTNTNVFTQVMGGTDNVAIGAFNGSGTFNIDTSKIAVIAGDNDMAVGLDNVDPAILNIANTAVAVSGGMTPTISEGTINDDGGNTCSTNGNPPVPCII